MILNGASKGYNRAPSGLSIPHLCFLIVLKWGEWLQTRAFPLSNWGFGKFIGQTYTTQEAQVNCWEGSKIQRTPCLPEKCNCPVSTQILKITRDLTSGTAVYYSPAPIFPPVAFLVPSWQMERLFPLIFCCSRQRLQSEKALKAQLRHICDRS